MLEKKKIYGMVHVRALPGTPKNSKTIDEIVEIALKETKVYKKHNLDGIILENMHDVPYCRGSVGPEIVSSMTRTAIEVRKIWSKPLGLQILAGANKEALAAAKAANLDFIRAEGFVFSHVADEGWMDACAAELLRYRKNIDAGKIKIFTDIKKKHSSHFITKDLSITDFAEAANFFLSDGLIITGNSTGKAVDLDELKRLRKETKLPILIGSGLTVNNIEKYYKYADGFIIGSFFKKNGYWENELSEKRIVELLNKVR